MCPHLHYIGPQIAWTKHVRFQFSFPNAKTKPLEHLQAGTTTATPTTPLQQHNRTGTTTATPPATPSTTPLQHPRTSTSTTTATPSSDTLGDSSRAESAKRHHHSDTQLKLFGKNTCLISQPRRECLWDLLQVDIFHFLFHSIHYTPSPRCKRTRKN